MYNLKSLGIVGRLGKGHQLGSESASGLPPHTFVKEDESVSQGREEKYMLCQCFFWRSQRSGTDHHLHKVISEARTGRALGNHAACPPHHQR